MAELPLDEGIARFKQNEDRLDQFVNDATGYTASGGEQVSSLRALAEQVAQFYGGIYSTTSAGIAATSSGEYFSVPVTDGLNLYLNNSGVAVLQTTFADKAIATYGRFLFTVRDTTFSFDENGNDVILSWSILRMLKGSNAVSQIADLPETTLAANRALYIDVENDSVPYPVHEDDYTNVAADVITGGKVLLVANYVSGYLIGEIAESFVRQEIKDSVARSNYGRVEFNTGSSMSFDESTGTISWVDISLKGGLGGSIQIANVTDLVLPNGDCLYVDMTESSPLTVQQAAYLSIYQDSYNGDKIMLIANQSDKWMGQLVPFLRDAAIEAKADNATDIAKYARRYASGAITNIRQGNSTNFIVDITEGRVYDENRGSSAFVAKIAPLTDQILAPVQGLVVDLENGSVDGEGRIIPVKVNLPDPAAPDWQTGNSIVLVANTGQGQGSLFGEYKEIPHFHSRKIGVYDGRAAFSTSSATTSPTYDSATRLLSWPELVIQIKDDYGEKRSRVKLQAGSIVIPAGKYYVVYLDMDQVLYDLTPNTAVSVAQYTSGGWDGEDDSQMPLFAASDDVSYPICFPPTRGCSYWPQTSDYDPNEILVTQTTDTVNVLIKGSNPESDQYVLYRMYHAVNTSTGTDVWRINGIYAATRTGETSWTQGDQFCNTGEQETAIKQQGKSDFMGGTAHGDELMTSMTMLIDGVVAEPDGSTAYRCSKVEFFQASDMFEVDTVPGQTNRLAKNYKRWVYEKGELELFQRVEWEAAIELQVTYMTMLTIKRWIGAVQITDKGFRSPLYLEEDISDTYDITITNGGSNFSLDDEVEIEAQDLSGTGMLGVVTGVNAGAITSIKVTNNGSGYTKNETVNINATDGSGSGAVGQVVSGFTMVYTPAQILKASGPSGYSAEVEILEGWDKPNRNSRFSNSESYNKFYFDFTGSAYNTTIGEVFESRTRYKVDNRN